jgi:putative nucleotidyltransferase with HDIG domain
MGSPKVDPAIAAPVATPPGDAEVASERPNRLGGAFDALQRLPALAKPRERLLRSLRGANPVQNEIVAAIESDPALTIACLGMTNRSGRVRARVDSVRDVVSALPPEGIAFLATRAPTVGTFEHGGAWRGLPHQFRIHAIATQAAADRIATEVGYKELARLRCSALLHDIGKLVLAYAYAEYPDGVAGTDGPPEARLVRERRELGIDHATVGGVAARRLGLPEGIALAIQQHHSSTAATEGSIVRLADALAHYWSGDAVDPAQLAELGQSLGLSADFLTSLTCDLPFGGPAGAASFAEPSPLSPREQEVLRLLATGNQYKVIAAELGVSTSTVRTHLHNLYGKMDVVDRAQAVLSASKRGWI